MISYNNKIPLEWNEMIEHERMIYEKQSIRNDELLEEVNVNGIFQRKKNEFYDKIFNHPQNIFILENENFPPIVGRKILSQLYLQGRINAPNCSQVTASMLLGFLAKKRLSDDNVSIQYYPLNDSEKVSLFAKLAKDRLTNIYFPFNYIDFDSKKEKQCAPTGWKLSPERALNLANGEEHIRAYTCHYFKDIINESCVIYDPACSTGQFLLSVKQEFPSCRTIGQDLSAEMTDYAKDFVDEIYTGDAMQSPLLDDSVDIMFLRFLNSEIVTTPIAHELFDVLEKKVKKGGYIVLFGHTAVLIRQEYFLEKGNFIIVNSLGYSRTSDAIFQYYVIKKK